MKPHKAKCSTIYQIRLENTIAFRHSNGRFQVPHVIDSSIDHIGCTNN